jgi:hypothetical protein
MIKSITPSGRYIQVTGAASSTYVNGYSGLQGVGNMRFNTSSQSMEVFDGNNWITLNMSIPSIGLTTEAESLLDWARKKRNEELELESLAQTNPTIKDLVEQVKIKQDQIKMVQTLLKSPGNEPVEMMGS